jgi:hypothetical protein
MDREAGHSLTSTAEATDDRRIPKKKKELHGLSLRATAACRRS